MGHFIRKNIINIITKHANFFFSEIPLKAECVLEQSSVVEGTITLHEFSSATKITGNIVGLSEGKHGFHVHEFGNTENGCKSFGGHYNPFAIKHGKKYTMTCIFFMYHSNIKHIKFEINNQKHFSTIQTKYGAMTEWF